MHRRPKRQLQPSRLTFRSFPSVQIPFCNHLHVLFLFILTCIWNPRQIPSDLHPHNTFIHLLIIAVYSGSASRGCWSPSQHTWGERQETTADSPPVHRRARSLTHQGNLTPQSINLKFTSLWQEATCASQRHPVWEASLKNLQL